MLTLIAVSSLKPSSSSSNTPTLSSPAVLSACYPNIDLQKANRCWWSLARLKMEMGMMAYLDFGSSYLLLMMLSSDPSSPRGGTAGRQLASYWQPPSFYRYNQWKYFRYIVYITLKIVLLNRYNHTMKEWYFLPTAVQTSIISETSKYWLRLYTHCVNT